MNRQLQNSKNEKGFTLVELMIVVAIIGILAAIAIPNFRSYQLKSKTSEAKANLGAIKTSQEAYRAENDVYLLCTTEPATVPGSSKLNWTAGGGFQTIGFEPSGDVYYSYGTNAGTIGVVPTYVAFAQGDLDDDGTTSAGNAFTAVAVSKTTIALERAAITAGVNANDAIFTMGSDNSFNDEHPGIW
jgi:type IV pilus assembly protein PilA